MRSALLLPMLAVTASTAAFAWGDNETVRGNGDITTEKRAIADVTAIGAGGGLKVDVQKGAPSLTIETDRNLLQYVQTEVKDGRLTIAPKRNTSLKPTKAIKVTITVPSLTAVSASGGVDFNVEAPLLKNAKVEANGGVNMHVANIDADLLDIDASGGVEMSLSGRASAATVDLSGGVQVHAARLAVKNMKLDASGGCGLDVAVEDALQGDISGGVDVQVHGAPQVKVSRSGGAAVRLRD